MIELKIEKKNGGYFIAEYNPEMFGISYIPGDEAIVITNDEGKPIKVFADNIGFIIQKDIDGIPNFAVSTYETIQGRGGFKNSLHHYRVEANGKFFEVSEHKLGSIFKETTYLTGNAFLVDEDHYSGHIYNMKETSRRFSRIYFDDKVNSIIGDGVILVSEEKSVRPDVRDVITYGISPETLRIVTPIYSELQQRLIPVHTKEELEVISEKLHSTLGLRLNMERYNEDELTISIEIENTLNELARNMPKAESVYLSGIDHKVNEDFVRKFTNRGN